MQTARSGDPPGGTFFLCAELLVSGKNAFGRGESALVSGENALGGALGGSKNAFGGGESVLVSGKNTFGGGEDALVSGKKCICRW